MRRLAIRLAPLVLLASAACATAPIMTSRNVDIPRFMGDWYVLAHIPAPQEANAWNAVETYRLADGKRDVVETTFTFREGGFDGPLVTLKPTGYVSDDPAAWGMRFYWWQGPFLFEYLVLHVDEGHTETVIGRSARDYAWIMARTPSVSDADRARLEDVVRRAGYDVSKLRRVPQRWGEKPDLSPEERYPAGR